MGVLPEQFSTYNKKVQTVEQYSQLKDNSLDRCPDSREEQVDGHIDLYAKGNYFVNIIDVTAIVGNTYTVRFHNIYAILYNEDDETVPLEINNVDIALSNADGLYSPDDLDEYVTYVISVDSDTAWTVTSDTKSFGDCLDKGSDISFAASNALATLDNADISEIPLNKKDLSNAVDPNTLANSDVPYAAAYAITSTLNFTPTSEKAGLIDTGMSDSPSSPPDDSETTYDMTQLTDAFGNIYYFSIDLPITTYETAHNYSIRFSTVAVSTDPVFLKLLATEAYGSEVYNEDLLDKLAEMYDKTGKHIPNMNEPSLIDNNVNPVEMSRGPYFTLLDLDTTEDVELLKNTTYYKEADIIAAYWDTYGDADRTINQLRADRTKALPSNIATIVQEDVQSVDLNDYLIKNNDLEQDAPYALRVYKNGIKILTKQSVIEEAILETNVWLREQKNWAMEKAVVLTDRVKKLNDMRLDHQSRLYRSATCMLNDTLGSNTASSLNSVLEAELSEELDTYGMNFDLIKNNILVKNITPDTQLNILADGLQSEDTAVDAATIWGPIKDNIKDEIQNESLHKALLAQGVPYTDAKDMTINDVDKVDALMREHANVNINDGNGNANYNTIPGFVSRQRAGKMAKATELLDVNPTTNKSNTLADDPEILRIQNATNDVNDVDKHIQNFYKEW